MSKTVESKTVDIILPEGQLEGTSAIMAAWLVKEGDWVKEGDPVAELETDKVVMEVCALASGKITQLSAAKGDQVETNQVLGKIEQGDVASSKLENSTIEKASFIKAAEAKKESASQQNQTDNNQLDSIDLDSADLDKTELSAREFVSPAVRRLLRENELQIDAIEGSGKRGRVTRDDVLKYLKNPPQEIVEPIIEKVKATEQVKVAEKITAVEKDASEIQAKSQLKTTPTTINQSRESRPLVGKKIPHTQMRKSIAKHMVNSLLQTSPHVTSVFEMDMSNIIEHRKWHKKEFADLNVKLTFTAYFLAAMVQGIKAVPNVNARFHDDALEIFDDVNIGVGTSLGDSGLVVPVVEQVQEMNLFEIAHNLTQQTIKARDGKLTTADMKNGTITISNHGVSGSLIATPIIINQPEVAILGVGKLEKRVVVETVDGVDTMVIRPKCYVSLSIDHRALDAHQTNQFLQVFVDTIENWGQ